MHHRRQGRRQQSQGAEASFHPRLRRTVSGRTQKDGVGTDSGGGGGAPTILGQHPSPTGDCGPWKSSWWCWPHCEKYTFNTFCVVYFISGPPLWTELRQVPCRWLAGVAPHLWSLGSTFPSLARGGPHAPPPKTHRSSVLGTPRQPPRQPRLSASGKTLSPSTETALLHKGDAVSGEALWRRVEML